EAPAVAEVQARYDGEVTIIGVAGRDDLLSIQDFVSNLDVGSFTHVVDEELEVWGAYGIRSQPAFAFLNDDGTVEVRNGSLGAQELSARVDALIAS
ncbi:MAG: TlpA family protein disulfide reductase, partial [Acidimicrobiales bacterium]